MGAAGAAGAVAVARVDLGAGGEPQALAAGVDTLYIGGTAPALVRFELGRAGQVTAIAGVEPGVTAIDALAGGDMLVWHGPRRLQRVRAGAAKAAEAPRDLPGDVRAVVVGAGEAFTVRGRGRFTPGLPTASAAPPHSALTEDASFDPEIFGIGADRSPVVAGPRRAAVWRLDRHELAHTNEPNGRRMYFQDPLPPGWQWIGGGVPRAPIAVLPTAPPLLAGRDGALSVIEGGGMHDVARAVVEAPYPEALAVVPLQSGAVLLVTGRSIVRIDSAGSQAVSLDAGARRWLAQAAQPGGRSLGPLHAAAFHAEEAVLATAAAPRVLWIDGLKARVVTVPAEPLGVAAGPGGAWMALLHVGQTIEGRAGAWRAGGSLEKLWPGTVSHCIGAFSGQDGRPRIVVQDRPIVCAGPGGLSICGPVVRVDPRRVWSLSGGLLIETQHIDTYLVDEGGARRIQDLRGGTLIAFAGPIGAPHALRDAGMLDGKGVHAYEVDRLGAAGWARIAGVPAPCVPQALAVGGAGEILVGCEGEVVIAR